MKQTRICTAFCACHSIWGRRHDDGTYSTRTPIHSGGQVQQEIEFVTDSELIKKIDTLIAIDEGTLSNDEIAEALKKYGRQGKCPRSGSFDGRKDILGNRAHAGDMIAWHGEKFVKTGKKE